MLKHRVIPCVLLKDWQLVKSVQFDSFRTVGHPTSTARIYNSRNVDELIVLDIDASLHNEEINTDLYSYSFFFHDNNQYELLLLFLF